MARTPLEQLECDRCGCVEVVGADAENPDPKRRDWVQIRADTRDMRTVISNATDENLPADLCSKCAGDIVQWFRSGLA